MAKEKFGTVEAAMNALFSAYDLAFSHEKLSNNSAKTDFSPQRKIQVLIDLLMRYNTQEYNNRKKNEPSYFHISGTRFFARECFANASRDVSPIIERMSKQIEAHHEKYNILPSNNKHPKFKETFTRQSGTKKVKLLKFIDDLLKENGLKEEFGRA